MESWENIILQWVNCLHDSNNCIKTIEELQDGKIYYNLINRIIPWNNKKSDKNQRDMILQFLKDEYPNFPFKNEDTAVSKLCIASLVLSRLSLEPIFHEMLCIKVDVDVQVKIKSILEIVYSLDKSITEEDLYNIFSLSREKDLKLLHTKPKFVLDEFVETPVPTDDDVQMEQTKQIRQLKVQIETMGYEKSDLVEDIAARDRQIKDLQDKLQEALSELKTLHANSSTHNSTNSFMEPKAKKDVESVCQKGESLEKYVNKLQTENKQLQNEKKALTIDVKQLYVEKYQELKEKNENKKKAIELMMLTKSQETQIKVLQNKLQEALSELKKTRVNSLKLNNSNFSMEAKDRNALETVNLSKLKGLEKSVMKLRTRNYHLEQEKQALIIDELKLYKEKHFILKEKNESKKRAIESVMLIKSQERQIKDLQNRLLGSEKNLTKLKTKNYQLVQEKRALFGELKLYKEKHFNLKERK